MIPLKIPISIALAYANFFPLIFSTPLCIFELPNLSLKSFKRASVGLGQSVLTPHGLAVQKCRPGEKGGGWHETSFSCPLRSMEGLWNKWEDQFVKFQKYACHTSLPLSIRSTTEVSKIITSSFNCIYGKLVGQPLKIFSIWEQMYLYSTCRNWKLKIAIIQSQP